MRAGRETVGVAPPRAQVYEYIRVRFVHKTHEMISSAVVIPERDLDFRPDENSSPTLKRKLSQSHNDERKRPRVDVDTLDYDDAPKSASREVQKESKSTSTTSPIARRSSALASNTVDEKKRNKRLFGSLLGTLSQTTARSNPAHKKRDEIEARQRERLKKENEDQEAERKRRRDELSQHRRRQQKVWEEEGIRLRHENMRAMAGFLRTKAEPVLYYLPWELRDEEEELLKTQREQVERQIRQELGTEKNEEQSILVSMEQDNEEDQVEPSTMPNDVDKKENEEDPEPGLDSRDAIQKQNGDIPIPDNPDSRRSTETLVNKSIEEPNERKHIEQDTKEDDHNGEELVEGQEDDVIY
ncbi:hypothetical protein LTS08_003213 [Lithohypha guttulata]|uniref:uncharacterized protein n=1 Tax=Lithohypha guttulata TaxID=1690604 RepID=UPI002DDE97A9|nr:hypothetical protein LTS08_003213 [Lithohypha guttulata]